MKNYLKKVTAIQASVKSLSAQLVFLTIIIVVVSSCEVWELPASKQVRQCQSPSAKIDFRAQKLETNISLGEVTGTIDAILWNFGDGESKTTTAPTVQHTYKASGSYVVKVTLTNTCTNSFSVSQTVSVSDAVPPVVTTQDPAAISTNSASLRMVLNDNGNAPVTRYGICYSSTNSLPTVNDQVIALNGSPTIGSINLFQAAQLTPNTVYYLRAFAENSAGPGYGNTKSITTSSQAVVSIGGTPTVSNNAASVFLRVDSPGSPAATQFGIVYSSTTSTPDLTNSLFVDVTNPAVGSNIGVNLTNLKANTLYTYRPYARTTAGPVYGASATFTTQAEAVSVSGMVLFLPFTNRSLTDASGYSNHAQAVNNLTFTTDRKGTPDGAVVLNGVNNYFFVPDHASLRPDSISISLWVRPANVNLPMQFFNKSRFSDSFFEQYAAQLKPAENGSGQQKVVAAFKQNGGCQVAKGWQDVTLNSVIQPNNWYHLTFTMGGKTAKLYMNGQLFGTTTLPASGIDKCPGGDLRFGAQIKEYEYFFNGAMDDIRIYQRVLSDNEVKTLYNQ